MNMDCFKELSSKKISLQGLLVFKGTAEEGIRVKISKIDFIILTKTQKLGRIDRG